MANKEMKQNMEQQVASLDNKTESLRADLSKIKAELSTKLQPLTDAMVKAESAILQLQDGLSEVSLLLQTLQAASYDGTFIWKIPEVTRRRQEARTGKTVSLYSAPFYTSRHGYKACLRQCSSHCVVSGRRRRLAQDRTTGQCLSACSGPPGSESLPV